MKVLLFVLLGVHIAACSYIACTPKLCDIICKHPPTIDDCIKQGKEFRPDSSLCGCCATCVDYLRVGEACKKPSSPRIERGYPIVEKHCQPGSTCVMNKCLVLP